MGRSSCGAGVKGRAWRSRKRRCRAGRCSPNANDRGVRTERSARRTTHSVEGAYGTLLVGVYSFMHNSARGLARGDSHAFDRKRSAKPVWACGWSSQTRRRRPEESVQTDQHDLRGQCDLRGSAALVRRCAASPASRSYGPATPSTAPPGSRDPRVEPDISSSSPVAPHGRGSATSTKVSISTGSTREPGTVAVRQRWPGYRIPASPNAYL